MRLDPARPAQTPRDTHPRPAPLRIDRPRVARPDLADAPLCPEGAPPAVSIHHQQAPTFRPFVLADVGPDGAPQAILVAPTPETVINRDTARTLITELLAVVSDGLPAQRSPGCVRDVA